MVHSKVVSIWKGRNKIPKQLLLNDILKKHMKYGLRNALSMSHEYVCNHDDFRGFQCLILKLNVSLYLNTNKFLQNYIFPSLTLLD